MRIPFHLRRRPADHRTVALLLEGPDAAGVLVLCARLDLDPAGRIHPVAGGLLLKLDRPAPGLLPGSLRLRALAPNLLVPVDAELVPALLDDEAEGLTRGRGLVFLADGRALAFDPRAPLDPATLLVARRTPGRSWVPLPEPRTLAERLEEILVELPGESPGPGGAGGEPADDDADPVLDPGNEDIGAEALRPRETSAASTVLGNATLGAGQWLVGLGQKLGLGGVAALGAGWIRKGLELAPKLGESVFGRQEAALRALLHEFRQGDPERALRHALPLGEPGGPRGAQPDPGAGLPTNTAKYSLADLFGKNDRGPARVWLGGQAVLAELARAYRQAAETALARGDHRRAAFIYGKLLRDYRTAANVLLRGGLYRDAAALFLARLNDVRAAALALESAGDLDRAVQLYRQIGAHEAAGDLLRRLGEDEAALAEYLVAAGILAASSAGPVAAGELLLAKAGRTDLALAQFRQGWGLRPANNAVACALRMARIFAERGGGDELLALMDEADALFRPLDQAQAAGWFYNEMVDLANMPALADARDDVRDRSLMALAAKLRQCAEGGVRPARALATFFGRANLWPPAFIRDAETALAATTAGRASEVRPTAAPGEFIRIGSGLVTAACAAVGFSEIFLGFETGEVYCFRPETSEVVLVLRYELSIASLAVTENARSLVVLGVGAAEQGDLSVYERRSDGSYWFVLATTLTGLSHPWLTPILSGPALGAFGLWNGRCLVMLEVASLITRGRFFEEEEAEPEPSFARPIPWGGQGNYAILLWKGRQWWVMDSSRQELEPLNLPGIARSPGSGLLARHPVAESWSGRKHLELAWIGGQSGILIWGSLQIGADAVENVCCGTSTARGGYRAAAIVRSGLVAGVSESDVDWFRGKSPRLQPVFTKAHGLAAVAAAFPCRRTGELILVAATGHVVRVAGVP